MELSADIDIDRYCCRIEHLLGQIDILRRMVVSGEFSEIDKLRHQRRIDELYSWIFAMSSEIDVYPT